MAKMITELAKKGKYNHPVLSEKGWWHKSYPSASKVHRLKGRPILILGAGGTLGTAFTNICNSRSLRCQAAFRNEVDITDASQIKDAINRYKPWAIINAAGYVKVDEAETEQNTCFNLNVQGAGNIAQLCNKHGIQLLTFSSDLVFNGKKESPYIEQDDMAPLNVYGESKARSEELVMSNFSSSLIIRTSAFFGPWDKYNFAQYILSSLKEGRSCQSAKDVTISPTYIPDLVNQSLDLLIDRETGIWHLTNDGKITWSGFAKIIAERGGYNNKNLISCSQDEINWKAKRPVYSVLQSDKGLKLPSLDDAIERFFKEKYI
jgi:dTDP-4-dehydrorhamnose reductase